MIGLFGEKFHFYYP